MRKTLTPDEHMHVDRIMGSPNVDAYGQRMCRCGEHVPFTPSTIWAHAQLCEHRQEKAERAAEQARLEERRKLDLALESA